MENKRLTIRTTSELASIYTDAANTINAAGIESLQGPSIQTYYKTGRKGEVVVFAGQEASMRSLHGLADVIFWTQKITNDANPNKATNR